MPSFKDRAVLLTGASEGIGRALALELAKQGAWLGLVARNEARLSELVAECEALGAKAIALPADVTDAAACHRAVEAGAAHFGRLDVLVNNAGRSMWTYFEEITDLSVAEQLIAINYYSAMWCTHAALPHLRKTKGLIVAVASVAGFSGIPTRTLYSASKHAMVGFFESLRVELMGSGLGVTIIAPDFVVTEIHARAFGPDGQPIGTGTLDRAKVMGPETCAKLMVKAMAKRQRLLITSARGKFGRWLKLLAPGLVDRIALRAVQKRE